MNLTILGDIPSNSSCMTKLKLDKEDELIQVIVDHTKIHAQLRYHSRSIKNTQYLVC